ncbi:MAG: DUF4097 family beta strand repeat-containing protein [Acidobacteriota bacterium]
MKTRALLVAISGFLMALSTLAGTAKLHKEHRFAPKPGGAFKVEASFHDVSVTIKEGATEVAVVVDAELTSWPSDAEEALAAYAPVFQESGDTLLVRCRPKSSMHVGFFNGSGSVVVVLPPGMDLNLDTGSGEITLKGENPDRDLTVDTGSGDVRVEGSCKNLEADVGSGRVVVRLSAPAGRVAVDTGSGDVEFHGEASEFRGDTGSGSIRAEGLVGRATFDTGSGDVEAVWSKVPGAVRIVADTGSGDVFLTFPKNSRLGGEIETSSGKVRCDFPGTADEQGKSFALSGGAGSADLRVDTGSGDVRVISAP